MVYLSLIRKSSTQRDIQSLTCTYEERQEHLDLNNNNLLNNERQKMASQNTTKSEINNIDKNYLIRKNMYDTSQSHDFNIDSLKDQLCV